MDDIIRNFQIGSVIRRHLVKGIKLASEKNISRFNIAQRMSELLNRRISVNTINKWTRRTDYYLFPLEYAPAFCEATGDYRLVKLLPTFLGMKVVDDQNAILKEIERLDEVAEEARKKEEQAKRQKEELKKKLYPGNGKGDINFIKVSQ